MNSPLSPQSLYWGARKFAHTAMQAHAKDDQDVFLLHAGVSVERLAKASLCQKSPFLLMETKGGEDTLLHIAGVRTSQRVRTVGAAQALSRLRTMGVLPPKDIELDELIELRNGIAHLDAQAEESFDGLAVFARATNSMLSHLGRDLDEYWGEWNELVEIVESVALEKASQAVARKIERARYRLRERLQGVPKDAISIIYSDAGNTSGDFGDYGLHWQCGTYSFHSPLECPACKCKGRLVTTLPLIGAGSPDGEFRRWFHCLLCGFNVPDDEFSACGIPEHIHFSNKEGAEIELTQETFREFIALGVLEAVEVENLLRYIRSEHEESINLPPTAPESHETERDSAATDA